VIFIPSEVLDLANTKRQVRSMLWSVRPVAVIRIPIPAIADVVNVDAWCVGR
jgi:hypothetical protein